MALRVLLSFLAYELVDGFDGSAALVSVAEVRPLSDDLIAQLSNLKLLVTHGTRNKALDLEAPRCATEKALKASSPGLSNADPSRYRLAQNVQGLSFL